MDKIKREDYIASAMLDYFFGLLSSSISSPSPFQYCSYTAQGAIIGGLRGDRSEIC